VDHQAILVVGGYQRGVVRHQVVLLVERRGCEHDLKIAQGKGEENDGRDDREEFTHGKKLLAKSSERSGSGYVRGTAPATNLFPTRCNWTTESRQLLSRYPVLNIQATTARH